MVEASRGPQCLPVPLQAAWDPHWTVESGGGLPVHAVIFQGVSVLPGSPWALPRAPGCAQTPPGALTGLSRVPQRPPRAAQSFPEKSCAVPEVQPGTACKCKHWALMQWCHLSCPPLSLGDMLATILAVVWLNLVCFYSAWKKIIAVNLAVQVTWILADREHKQEYWSWKMHPSGSWCHYRESRWEHAALFGESAGNHDGRAEL